MTDLRIDLFSGFRVVVGGRTVAPKAWSRRKPAALVKLLALAPGHRLRRDQAMETLWPEFERSGTCDLVPVADTIDIRRRRAKTGVPSPSTSVRPRR
jgi:DNA-binding response OmpR family regulator